MLSRILLSHRQCMNIGRSRLPLSRILCRFESTSQPSKTTTEVSGGVPPPPSPVRDWSARGDSGASSTKASPEVPSSPSFFSNPLEWWRIKNAHVKVLFTEYGIFAVATYLGIYVITLLCIFGAVRAGIVQGPDINAFLNKSFIKDIVSPGKDIEIHAAAADFGVAWLLTKTTEPFRLATAIALVPFLARRLPNSMRRLFRMKEK